MDSKSRVERYAQLREQIANIDVYSFDDIENVKKNSPEKKQHLQEDLLLDENKDSNIKKNTLTLSIDQLIEEHDQVSKNIGKKTMKNNYKKRNGFKFSLSMLAWIGVILVCLAIIVFIVLILLGVIS